MLMKEQDDDLEDISTSLQKLGQYGLQIGEELKNQDYLLSELDEDVMTTQARLVWATSCQGEILTSSKALGWWRPG